MKRTTNWQHLKDIAHLAGPDAELHIKLTNVSPDAEGAPDETVVVLKCRAGFIRAGKYLFAYPDIHGGGFPGRLEPNVWELQESDQDGRVHAMCVTETDPLGGKPDLPQEILAELERAGFHWEAVAARD